MKIILVSLLFFSFNNINSFSININEEQIKWLIVLGMPMMLGNIANKQLEKEQKINPMLANLTSSSAMVALTKIFISEQDSWLHLTKKYAAHMIVLSILNFLRKNNIFETIVEDYGQYFGILNETFPGALVKYIILYQIILNFFKVIPI